MKIKSVKITGFRAFEKEENSTFDFTSNEEIMDFASIYAPNGFGKTSFYDAIEWSITHQIQRFDRMDDFEKMRKENNLPLLLNNSSTSGKVTVETNNSKFENIINKRKKYNSKGKPSNEYFRNQILSQDLIDTFIKEERADKRYERFLEIDSDLKQYDSIYKKAVRVLDFIKQERTRINKEVEKEEKSLQMEIDYKQEFKKFDEINGIIAFLKKNNESLDYITKESYDETTHDNLSRNIKVRLLSLEEELTKISLQLDQIRLARDGEENSSEGVNNGIFRYIDNREKIEKFDVQIRELQRIISLIEKKEKIEASIDNIDKNLLEKREQLGVYFNIEKKIEIYLTLQKEIDELEKRIAEFGNQNTVKEREKSLFEEENILLINKTEQLQKLLKEDQGKLEQIPNQKIRLENLLKISEATRKSVSDLFNSISEKELKLSEVKIILEQFGYYESMIDSDLGILSEFRFFTNHQDLITNQLTLKKNLETKNESLKEIENKISSQDRFNNELKEYVSRGLEIITQTQTSDCPLCNHHYNSFEELSNSIVSNKFFDDQLRENLEIKISLETEIKDLKEQIIFGIEEINRTFVLIKSRFLNEQKSLVKELEKLNLEKLSKDEELKKSLESINEVLLFFGNKQNSDEIINELRNKISEAEADINKNTSLVNINSEKIKDIITSINSNVENINKLKENIKAKQVSDDYVIVINYFNTVLNQSKVDKVILLESKSLIEKSIQELNKEITDQKNSLEQLNIDLPPANLSKKEYNTRIQQILDSKSLILRIYDNYEGFIKSEFNIDLNGKSKSQIENEFLQLIDHKKQDQKLVEEKIGNYKIIEILKDDCLNATVSQKIQEKIDNYKKDLVRLKNAETHLCNERENIVKYLTKTIDEYFYTELINKIYKKIDPHPDYQSIQFKCEFADSKPRLQIYTVKLNSKGETEISVPALYFSTAQINILSLSIFLARALKTKNPDTKESVDCIFIDDPIQSMDSINILSFIDLFRGITLSLGKQLIVSTHEENFHLLLQKKIPKELFKSKYIEFETFGKVKKEK